MSRTQWWATGRLLSHGDRGPEVKELQRALNVALGLAPLDGVTGFFGDETEQKVRMYQQRNGLLDDGKAGPITQACLSQGYFEFSISRPPFVRQPSHTCWAAALESALRASWHGRPQWTVNDLLARYRPLGFLGPRGDITVPGFRRVVLDLRAGGRLLRGGDLRAEYVLSYLVRYRKHLVMVHDLTGSIGHAVVIYGVQVREGALQFLVLDPNDFLYNGYPALPVRAVQGESSRVILVGPEGDAGTRPR